MSKDRVIDNICTDDTAFFTAHFLHNRHGLDCTMSHEHDVVVNLQPEGVLVFRFISVRIQHFLPRIEELVRSACLWNRINESIAAFRLARTALGPLVDHCHQCRSILRGYLMNVPDNHVDDPTVSTKIFEYV